MRFRSALSLSIFCLILFHTARAQPTSFTYQGSLQNGGLPANGSYDFEFALFSAASGGSQFGSTQTVNGVMVDKGVFSVSLDFGAQFPGADRFLEIRVRPSGGGSFTILAPRQAIGSTPYAVKSLNAQTAANADNAANAATATNASQLGGVAANQFVQTTDARLSDARNPLPGSASYIQNQNAGPQASGNFNISGTGTANTLNATTRLGVGTSNAEKEVHVRGTGDQEVMIESSDVGGRKWSLQSSSGASDGRFEIVDRTAVGNRFTILADGKVGIGTILPTERLHVSGNSLVTGSITANVVNAGSQFNLAGSRIFHAANIENTFVGVNAGAANTNSIGNTFFGHSAGQANSTGGLNSFFGARAGLASSGFGNAFFGYEAGTENTSGGDNAFFGAGAGDSNTSASFNSFFGRAAGQSNTTGTRNSFFGRHAGFSNQTGSDNSFFGYEAGRASNSGNNSFFGFQSGLQATGINNSFFGWSSGLSTTTGTNNSFFGVRAGFNNILGNRNTFMGRDAGFASTDGSNNTFIGFNAGNNNTTGSDNTVIGANADLASAGLSFATAIGAGASVSTNNTVVIGRSADEVRIPGELRLFGGVDVGAGRLVYGSDIDGYVLEIANYNGFGTNANADVLKLTISSDFSDGSPAVPFQGNNYIAFKTQNSTGGSVRDVGAIQGNGNNGVQFISTGSDYAEYLPRLDKSEKIRPGDVVGVHNGNVTKKTGGSPRLMVISTGPAVLGNYPGENALAHHEKVAFIGQVPVRVRGAVSAGDLIVASGLNDGTGIAVPPDVIMPEQFDRVVGQAWESSNDAGIKLVRTAVGLIQRDPTVGRLIAANRQQAKRLAALEAKVTALAALLEPRKPSTVALTKTTSMRVKRER